MPPLIVILGPTATGKSELAIKLALIFNGEIISADSAIIRRNVDIGTAKPSKKQLDQVRHHLVNIIEPNDKFSVADYKKRAATAILDIIDRGKIPFVVGGTGLYIDSLLYDYSFAENTETLKREELNKLSLDQLKLMVQKKGIDISLIDSNNPRRLIRSIETNGQVGHRQPLRANTLIIGLMNHPELVRSSIADRVDRMMSLGLKSEVTSLFNSYGPDSEVFKMIGYKEWLGFLKGLLSIEEVKEQIIKDTRSLMKRQITWFKRNKSIQWFITPVKEQQIIDLIATFLN